MERQTLGLILLFAALERRILLRCLIKLVFSCSLSVSLIFEHSRIFASVLATEKLTASEIELLVTELDHYLSMLKMSFHEADLGRRRIIQSTVTNSLRSLKEFGPVNVETLTHLLHMTSSIQLARDLFLVSITNRNRSVVKDLLMRADRLQRGIDNSNSQTSKIVKSNFVMLRTSVVDLVEKTRQAPDTPAAFIEKLSALSLKLRLKEPLVDQGDRPKAYEHAKEVVCDLYRLESSLESLMAVKNMSVHAGEILWIRMYLEHLGDWPQGTFAECQ